MSARHRQSSAKRRAAAPALIAAAAVAVLAIALLVWIQLRNDRVEELRKQTPAFVFEVQSVRSIPTDREQRSPAEARAAAKAVRATLTKLYRFAFLDPADWQSGSYDPAWALFEEDATEDARSDGEILTLGADAGEKFQKVLPTEGALDIRVLMDGSGRPLTAVALVDFTAEGTQRDGRVLSIVSRGQYFLRPGEDGWSIYAYQVKRLDEPSGSEGGS